MQATEQIFKMANNVVAKLPQIANDALEAAAPDMIKANWKQLDEGKKNDDNPITPFYSPSYAKFKGFSIPNLKLKNDFRNSIDVDFRQSEMTWGASDEKTPFLLDKYSDDVLGLTKDNAETIFNKRIYPKQDKFLNANAKKYL